MSKIERAGRETYIERDREIERQRETARQPDSETTTQQESEMERDSETTRSDTARHRDRSKRLQIHLHRLCGSRPHGPQPCRRTTVQCRPAPHFVQQHSIGSRSLQTEALGLKSAFWLKNVPLSGEVTDFHKIKMLIASLDCLPLVSGELVQYPAAHQLSVIHGHIAVVHQRLYR